MPEDSNLGDAFPPKCRKLKCCGERFAKKLSGHTEEKSKEKKELHKVCWGLGGNFGLDVLP